MRASITPAVDPIKQKPTVAPTPNLTASETEAGSSIATLWLKVNQENHPPASIPSTLVPLTACPNCQQTLAPPRAAGRQICVRCGWTNKPQSSSPGATPRSDNGSIDTGTASTDTDTDADILRLLQQAASESLSNMKPRKKP